MFRIVRLINTVRSGRASFGAILMLALTINGLITVAGSVTTAHGYNQDVEKLNRFVQTSSSSDAEVKIFREGRDLISEEDWDEASGKFAEYMRKYPKGKDVDAAMYWMAYALAKQEKFQEADRALARLINTFPNSRWRDDAKALQLQLPNKQPDQNIEGYSEETQIIALQSLFQGNPERGAGMAAEILRDPKRSKRLKEAAVTLIGQHHSSTGMDLLMNIARNEADTKLRKAAIFWLGQSGDERALDMLKEFATSSTDAEVGKAAIFAISQNGGARAMQMLSEMARSASNRKLREEAIFWLGQRGGDEGSADELLRIYDADNDTEIRKKIIFSLSQMGNERARQKLFDIARTSDNPATRGEAIFWIGQTGGGRGVDSLIQLYDGEKAIEVKKKIIFSISQNRAKQGIRKLMEIAKSDPAVELRKEAVFWLGQSGDPEAAKFLEEIVK